jgi:hypothetical protein
MRSFRLAMIAALVLGAAALAPAQDRRGGQYGPGDRYGYDRRGGGPAYQIGVEDGRRDGERDAYTRHSFRPTNSGNYRHADRGYRREFGNKQYYKDTYRSGYMEGYRAGYQQRGRRW